MINALIQDRSGWKVNLSVPYRVLLFLAIERAEQPLYVDNAELSEPG